MNGGHRFIRGQPVQNNERTRADNKQGDEKMEKTYTVTVTYEAEIITTATAEEIEAGIWVGGLEICRMVRDSGIGTSKIETIDADATDVVVEEE